MPATSPANLSTLAADPRDCRPSVLVAKDRALSRSTSLDAVFLEPPVERAAGEAEEGRGFDAVPVARLERVHDALFFADLRAFRAAFVAAARARPGLFLRPPAARARRGRPAG